MLKTLCLKKALSTNQKDLYILAFSRVLDHKKKKKSPPSGFEKDLNTNELPYKGFT